VKWVTGEPVLQAGSKEKRLNEHNIKLKLSTILAAFFYINSLISYLVK
jgi:hypothetical protein